MVRPILYTPRHLNSDPNNQSNPPKDHSNPPPKRAWTIRSFFPVDTKTKAQKQRERRKKERSAKAAEANSLRTPSPPPKPTDKRARNKAQRREAWNHARLKDPPELQTSTSLSTDQTNPPAKRNKAADREGELREAVEYWDKNCNNVGVTKAGVAKKFKFNPNTFRKYVHDDVTKRLAIGARSGVAPKVSREESEFLTQYTIRCDRANDGKSQKHITEALLDIRQDLTPIQAKNFIARTWKKYSRGRIKQRAVKAQKTTSKRSQCTVAQQFRWFKNVERGLNFLREKNTGTCKRTGKHFGELIEHFVIGMDETNLIADADGDLKVLGEVGKRKHEKKVSDYRGSITMVRCGAASGANGPTAFLLKGKRKRAGFTDKYLENEGAAPGSTIVMTENAFMTDEAWEEVSAKVGMRFRSLTIRRVWLKYG